MPVTMPRRGVVGTLLLMATGLCASPVAAQTLRGLLLDGETQMPINLGRVTLLTEDRDSLASTLTDREGYFSLTAAEPGSYRIVGTALGYRGSILGPFDLDEGTVQIVQFQLGPLPVPVVGVVVSAERLSEPEVPTLVATGFYDRLVEGRGEFLTPGEIAHSSVRFTPQLFREMTFVKLQPIRDGASAPWNDRVWVRPADPNAIGAAPVCAPRVYVDDLYINLERMDPQPSLEDLVPKDELEAVEVYRAPIGPNRYLMTSPCGVILLWTKRRR